VKEAGLAELSTLIDSVRRSASARTTSGELRRDRLYLVSRTSHLAEGWCDRVPALELAGDAGGAELGEAVQEAAQKQGVGVVWESPADIIPLPAGWQDRSLTATIGQGDAGNVLELRHFDPYSVVLRLIARGDEPDYVAALEYVLHGWVEPARLESLLTEVVPRMTNQTLAQDPAEFRRKFKGLRQLYGRSHAVYSPGGTRAGEAVSIGVTLPGI
jgi:hypothetical protein